MLVYNYDENGYYTYSEDAFLDPEASKIQGERVYFLPSYATFDIPPKKEGFVAQFKDNKWGLIPDYRGKFCVNKEMVLEEIKEVGEPAEGYVLISDNQKEIILEHPNYYIIQDDKLVLNLDYAKEEQEKEQKRIAMLSMTKYDFFKYVCKPNNISYAELTQLVNSDDDIAAAWDLCKDVYRGDEILINTVKAYLPAMTDELLTEIFEKYGGQRDN